MILYITYVIQYNKLQFYVIDKSNTLTKGRSLSQVLFQQTFINNPETATTLFSLRQTDTIIVGIRFH